MKEKILEAAIEAFNEKGLKFTMDDLAKKLSMSKKTLYTVFQDKDELFFAMVDYCFGAIKEEEKKIIDNTNMDIMEKIRKIIIVLPDRYKNINLQQVYNMREKFPVAYKEVERRLETDWEPTIQLFEQAMKEGKMRAINVVIFKTMLEATIEQFFQKPILIDAGISYEAALEEMAEILIRGIETHSV